MYKPDYNNLRDATKFSWFVNASCNALMEVTGIPIKEFNLNPDAGVEVYRKGRPIIKEIFGGDVGVPAPTTPPVSYGHINTLGAELIFPENGEVNHSTLCDSLERGIEILKKPVDFGKTGMVPYYLEYMQKLKQNFPDEKIGFGFGAQGPVTTAYLLRRDSFFYDPYDNPERTMEFLALIAASVVKFKKYFARTLYGESDINPQGCGLCDDCAAMLGPDLWPDFVIPYINYYFENMTTGTRFAHIEDLRPNHLELLEKLYLDFYDPSVSPQINPCIIKNNTRVPFAWRLASFHYPDMNLTDIRDFVFKAAADGAGRVFTYVPENSCCLENIEKVKTFIDAAKQVDSALCRGASRSEIMTWVTRDGMNKFWDNWN